MVFAGDKKKGTSLLSSAETKLKNILVPYVPLKVETYHLTYTTILWSALIIVFSYFAISNINWLWGVSLMIFFQYITDLLDGEIGRRRNTGLIKWGFYMDHFLDYIFLCSILIGYTLLLPDKYKILEFFILALFGAFMVNSFLAFAATNEFKISYMGIGPTEVRIVFILVNTFLILFGTTYIAFTAPYILVASLLGLTYTVYKTQKYIWILDMEAKRKSRRAKK